MTATTPTLQDLPEQLALLRKSTSPSGQVLLLNTRDNTLSIGYAAFQPPGIIVLIEQWRLTLPECLPLPELAEYIMGQLPHDYLKFHSQVTPPECMR